MSHQVSYIWTIGYMDSGKPMMGGPYVDEQEAREGTDHLSRVQFIRLGTRDRNVAFPQLKNRIKHARRSEPVAADRRRSVISRILRRSNEHEGDIPEDDRDAAA